MFLGRRWGSKHRVQRPCSACINKGWGAGGQGRAPTPIEAQQLCLGFLDDSEDSALVQRHQCSCCREKELNDAHPAFARAVCAVLELNPHFLPISKITAVAMITHERLGAESSGSP